MPKPTKQSNYRGSQRVDSPEKAYIRDVDNDLNQLFAKFKDFIEFNSLTVGNTESNMAVTDTGDLTFVGSNTGLPYGGICRIENSDPTTILVSGVKVLVTAFDTDGPGNNMGVSATNNKLTIEKTGSYLVNCSITMDSVVGAGATFEWEVMNGSANALGCLHTDRSVSGGGGETGAASISGIVHLEAGDVLEVWVENETGTQNVIIEDISLSAVQVGG